MMKRIEYFDCSKEVDMLKAEKVLKDRNVVKNEVVNFPYLMLVWEEE
jgi:hypothetical protein